MESGSHSGECAERLDSRGVGSLEEGRRSREIVHRVSSQHRILCKGKLFSVWLVFLVIFVIICKIFIYCLISVMVLLDVGCKIKVKTLVKPVEVAGDLAIVVLIVASTSWYLDFFNVRMLCDVGSPLHCRARLPDARDHTLEKLELRYLPTISCARPHNGILVFMEFLKSIGEPFERMSGKNWCLCKIAEVEEGAESCKKLPRDAASYHAYDVPLYRPVVTTHNLLQLRDPFVKPSIPYKGLDDGETEIQLLSPYHHNTPFDIMIPSESMKVMEGLNSDKIARI